MANLPPQPEPRNPVQRLWALFVACWVVFLVTLVGWLAIGFGQVGSHLAVSHVINLSGRQRMLGQRIAKASALIVCGDAADRAARRDEIRESVEVWQRVQAGLQNGDAGLGLPKPTGGEALTLLPVAQPHFDAMRDSAAALAGLVDDANGLADGPRADALLKSILAHERPFLAAMDHITDQFESDAEAGAKTDRALNLAMASLLAIAVLLQAVLLFRPAVRRVRDGARELLRARTDLSESERLFRDLTDSVPMLIWVSDAQGKVTYFNRMWASFTGRPLGAALGDGWRDGFHPEDGPRALAAYAHAVTHHTPFEIDYRYKGRNDQYRHVINRGSPRFASDGSFQGMIGSAVDITERAQSEQKFRFLFESSADAHVIFDLENNILDCNQAAVDMIGAKTKTEVLALHGTQLSSAEQPDGRTVEEARTFVTDAIAARGVARFDWRLKKIGGETFMAEVVLTRVMLGSKLCSLAVWHDLTERYESERLLRSAKETADKARRDAELASDYKSQFLASMSHEIRTPMTAIVGYTDLLSRPHQTASDYAEWSRLIRHNADYLLSIINDILDLSKIEAGQINIHPQASALVPIFEEIDSLFRPRAIEKMLRFGIAYDGLLPAWVRTDATRLKQIFVNLVSNGIKFTDAGAVHVDVRVVRDDDASVIRAANDADGTRAVLVAEVRDTGIGIPPARINQLFTPFTQLHETAAAARRHGGTGLGLAISRQFARLLGGEIDVQSEPGVGSAFTVRIDLGPAEDLDFIDPAVARGVDRRVSRNVRPDLSGTVALVTDDNPDNQRIIRFLLEESGARVVTADNGQVALDSIARAAAAADPFDFVLMDVQMPVMDGLEAVAALRRGGDDTPVIALTAFAMSGDEERCLAAGCNAYVTKPIIPDDLFGAISRFLSQAWVVAGPAVARDQEQRRGRPTDTLPRDPVKMQNFSPETPAAAAAGPLVSTMRDDPSFAPLIVEYLAGFPATIAQLNDALAAADVAQLNVLCHRLKGSGGGYGYPVITERAKTAEAALRRQAPQDEYRPLVQSLIELLERCLPDF